MQNVKFVGKTATQDEFFMKWFELFGLKRKLTVLCPDESFFELHSWATEQEKGEIWVQNSNFLANLKSLNHFYEKRTMYYL